MNNFDNESISVEVKKLRSLKYDSLCQYLQKKYGVVGGPYFINEKCRTKNEKIKRTSEGLFIHHIYEKKAIMLSHSEYAIAQPFEWQDGNNLVYCNYFEHMLLHIAIVKEFLKEEAQKTKTAVGIGGLINFMIPEIIDYINGYQYSKEYMRTALSVIDGNELLFVDIVEGLYNYVFNHHDIFAIIYKICYKSFRRLRNAFTCGKMTNNGKYTNLLFKYRVLKKQIKLVGFDYFKLIFDDALTKPGYDYKLALKNYGEYNRITFNYCGKNGNIISKEYAISSNEHVDIQIIEEQYFRKLNISNRISYLIKKDSVVSFKENKRCKNKSKKYCLTIDGIVVENHNYTEKEASEIAATNK